MARSIRSLLLVGISIPLAVSAVGAGRKKTDPGAALKTAADYFGNLDLEKALRWTGIVLRDSPGTPEARRAALLKAVVSTVKLQTCEMTAKKYAEAMPKSPLRDERRRCRSLFLKATARSVLAGEALIGDVRRLLAHVGEPMTVEIDKNFDSLDLYKSAYTPYKMMVKHGRVPTTREQKTIEKHLSGMAFCVVVSSMLRGPNPRDEKIAREFEKRQVVKGTVNWAGVLTAAGDWLVRYAATCHVGWIDPKLNKLVSDPKRAVEGYLAAKRCFERVRELTKGLPLDKGGAHADERIEEIGKRLEDLGKAKSAGRGGRG
jgi:hypothetical protein